MNAVVEIWRNLSSPNSAGLEKLASILELSVPEVAQIPNDPRLSYRRFAIRKRSRKPRQIDEPSGRLKQLQKRLLANYLRGLTVSSAATAFRRGMSIATHASRHLRQEIVLTADLADFFPSTSSHRIRDWLRRQGWHGQALKVVMRLTSYRGALPQGSPTSPALSNLVNYQLDCDLSEMATLSRGRYSRYCDDLAFSWSNSHEPTAWRPQVEARLGRYGYAVNQEKGWKLQTASQNPELTGIAICHGTRLAPSKENKRKIRRLRWKRKSEHERQQWQGYRGFLLSLKRKRPFTR